MYENGCMNGLTDTTFGPDATTTRGMIVTMLYRHENEPTVAGENPFADVKDTQYYADAINWAAENDIVTGYDETTFGPDDTITREQMATILYRYAAYKGYDTTQGGMAAVSYTHLDVYKRQVPVPIPSTSTLALSFWVTRAMTGAASA